MYVSHGGIAFGRSGNAGRKVDDNEFEGIGRDDDYASWDIDRNNYLDSGEFYDGYFSYFDANEDAHWDGNEWDDAGEEGILDF